MKKLVLFIISFILNFNLIANSLSYDSKKVSYDCYEVIKYMTKYHEKYGKGDVDYSEVYVTIKYWANYHDIDLAFAMTFFAIESGFTYVCTSHQNALGMGQVTEVALKDYNDWYGEKISIKDLNDKRHYDINIMVALGYIRMCWGRYSVIQNGEDLIKSYNIGIGNLKKIKDGTYSEDNRWAISANKYFNKFYEVYSDFIKCRR